MITSAAVEHFKQIAPLVNLIPGGAIFGTTDRGLHLEAGVGRVDMPAFEVRKDSVKEGCVVIKPSGSPPGYWMMAGWSGISDNSPCFEGDKVVGTIQVVQPRVNQYSRFPDFAPVIADISRSFCVANGYPRMWA